jgi:hypothetical protein
MQDHLPLAGVMEVLRRSERPLAQNLPLREDPKLTVRHEANSLTAFAFRNGFLEDLHAGKWSPMLEDPSYSRVTDDEMRKLMIESSAKVAQWLYLRELLRERHRDLYFAFVEGYRRLYCRNWESRKCAVKLRKQRTPATPCFACNEVIAQGWNYCPHCGTPKG